VTHKPFNKGNLVEEYTTDEGTRVKIYDGALVATSRYDPRVKAILRRIAKIAIQNEMKKQQKK
jgi:hypothetical protein